MSSIANYLPDPDILLDLQPEELAGVLLEYLISLDTMQKGQLNRHNFILHSADSYPLERRSQIQEALTEAWVWLEREGLLAPKPNVQGEWVFITRRGHQVADRPGLTNYHRANLLPKHLLHGKLATMVWATFLRGDYDTAVFQAFKEVEVTVRTVCGFGNDDYGVDLMRQAFNSKTGTLTAQNQTDGEKDALAHLFAGAMGYYKNPASHRHVPIDDPVEAVEMIVLASHLLRIIDSRKKA